MARKKSLRRTFIYVVASVFFCASLYHHYLRDAISAFSSDQISVSNQISISDDLPTSPAEISFSTTNSTSSSSTADCDVHENLTDDAAVPPSESDPVAAPPPSQPPRISTAAVLLLDWDVLVIVPRETANLDDNYSCLFDTDEVSPASFSGLLYFPDRATFTCNMPLRARRILPYKEPLLLTNPENPPERESPPPLITRSKFMVYDSLTTDDDVVLFVKGVNKRQGVNRDPREFRCVFGDDVINGVKTAVTSSMQEVFRCERPELTAVAAETDNPVKVSIEIVAENILVPSTAYYTPRRKLSRRHGKSVLCATTMVYDVTKFLREWVVYHSTIGVEKFLLYDNGSDDDLQKAVEELVKEGFDINTYFWLWPKTQEAGFSHSVLYARDACTWMMYMDVDEFVYSPSWYNISHPSPFLLPSSISSKSSKLGQISINCLEFGPSGQVIHPPMGVIQGYNCRLKYENRHKSIVRLDAIDDSLLNVIHHFHLKHGYKTRKLSSSSMVVNHYKYQAWSEFRVKYRRRVSAYVYDWTDQANPKSNDRAPGLGYDPVEPEGWPNKYCDVHDNRLRDLSLRWFGIESDSELECHGKDDECEARRDFLFQIVFLFQNNQT